MPKNSHVGKEIHVYKGHVFSGIYVKFLQCIRIEYRLEFDLLFEKASWKVPAISFKECIPKEIGLFSTF